MFNNSVTLLNIIDEFNKKMIYMRSIFMKILKIKIIKLLLTNFYQKLQNNITQKFLIMLEKKEIF